MIAGNFFQDDLDKEDTIQDDFDTMDAYEDTSDVVQMFEDEELQDENSERSQRRRGIWLSEDKVLLGKRLMVRIDPLLFSLTFACIFLRKGSL